MDDNILPAKEITNGLQQHPITSSLPPTPLSPPSALLSDPPSVRLSSSPASSPRIVESPPNRTHSIHPERGILLAPRTQHRKNFLDLSSDEDTEWEDDNGTRNFSEVESQGNRVSRGTFESNSNGEEARRSRRESEYLTALPPFNQIPDHDSGAVTGTGTGTPVERDPATSARTVSVKRVGKGNLVHNRGSPRSSIFSNASSDVVPQPLRLSQGLGDGYSYPESDRGISLRASMSTQEQWKRRRNTSESESIRANYILNAHWRTMQALESMPTSPPPPPPPLPTAHRPRGEGRQRQLKFVAPIQTELDPTRPPHLPAHFIKTPYPFSPKKEFPRPKTRPRRTEEDQATSKDEHERDDRGIHGLGITHEDSYAPSQRQTVPQRWHSSGLGDTVVYLSLRKSKRAARGVQRLGQIAIPRDLEAKGQVGERSIDFDDAYFARRLREEYKAVLGPWCTLRALSARKLSHIQLGQVGAWSGLPPDDVEALLAAGAGQAVSPLFTEQGLLQLYRRPQTGKARYAWVHWARRLSPLAGDEASVTTVQFVHVFSPVKILLVVGLMLGLAVAAALLWIFLGEGGVRAERVGSGMLIGGMVGGIEAVVFAAWAVGSWMWL